MRQYSPLIAALIAVATGAAAGADSAAVDRAVEPPPHQVVAIYFHRTIRCPTCKRISSYVEEAVKTAFARELKTRSVELHMVDFEDGKNQQLAQAYKITGPTLVLADVYDGQTKRWTPMPKVWSLVGQKEKFLAYVQDGITTYLHGEPPS